MKIAITGGTGFIGRHLARTLIRDGHTVVLIVRRRMEHETHLVQSQYSRLAVVGLEDEAKLVDAMTGCDAVAHCAGINREIGSQTYQRIHVEGTQHVVNAAERACVKRIALLSFLRARPDCGSRYHESKWAAEEIVRASKLDYTVLKCGVIYGVGDHMLDHLSHAFHTFPIFGLVGLTEKLIRPTAVEDVVKILMASLVDGQLSRKTVGVMGPETMALKDAVERVAEAVGKSPAYIRLPLWFHYGFGWCLERLMKTPLVSIAQVRILSEGIVEASPACGELPEELKPKTRFTAAQIRMGLPVAKGFTREDFRCFNHGMTAK